MIMHLIEQARELGKEYTNLNKDMIFTNLEQTLQLLGFISPFLLAYIAYINNKKNQIQTQLNEKKRETFEGFIDALIESLNQQNEKNKIKELEKQMLVLKRNLILFTSPKCIKAHNKWLLNHDSYKENNKYLFTNLEEFIKALREEVGLTNNGLKKYDVLQVFIKENIEKSLKDN